MNTLFTLDYFCNFEDHDGAPFTKMPEELMREIEKLDGFASAHKIDLYWSENSNVYIPTLYTAAGTIIQSLHSESIFLSVPRTEQFIQGVKKGDDWIFVGGPYYGFVIEGVIKAEEFLKSLLSTIPKNKGFVPRKWYEH